MRAARDYGIKVMGDIMAAPDKVECARMLEANGVDYIIVHTGFDERHETPGLSPLDDLPAVAAAVHVPVQAVGGLTLDQIVRLPHMNAPLVVVGAPLAISDQAFVAGLPSDRSGERSPPGRADRPRRRVAHLIESKEAPIRAPLS